MDKLLFTFNVILPIILPILLGYILKKINFLKEEFLNGINKLVFVVLLPVLLFSNLYLADLSNINWTFCGIASLAILALFFVGLVVVLFIKDPKQKGVMLQASFRSNYAIIGIPLATLLGGEEAGAQAAVVAAISVPIFNILAVIALSMFDKGENNKIDIKRILYKIVTNPLIIGVVSGIVVCLIGMLVDRASGNTRFLYHALNKNDGTVKFIGTTIDYIGRCATPMALIVLGGKFEFSAVKKLWPQLTISVVLRLVITPTIMLFIFYFIGYNTKTDFAILIALFATPIAVSSVPMAAQMGQDEELAGQIVVWTSALSAFSLFFIILICSLISIF